jgi:hypothetical protein
MAEDENIVVDVCTILPHFPTSHSLHSLRLHARNVPFQRTALTVDRSCLLTLALQDFGYLVLNVGVSTILVVYKR